MTNNDYTNQNDKKVILKERNVFTQVDMKRITIIVCEGYLSTLYFLNDQKPISVSRLLKDFERELSPYGFFRVNRNTIVNINNVYSFKGNRILTMIDNHKIFVSCRRAQLFKRFLESK